MKVILWSGVVSVAIWVLMFGFVNSVDACTSSIADPALLGGDCQGCFEVGSLSYTATGNWTVGPGGANFCAVQVCDGPCSGPQPTGGWTCFPAGTKIQMASNNQTNFNSQQSINNQPDWSVQENIEEVRVGDRVVSQDEKGNKSVSRVTKLDQPVRDF